jgi:hypothetical protein
MRAFFVFLLTIYYAYASLDQTRTRKGNPVSKFVRNFEQAISARSCKVITDIDDTVVSSGGHMFCGIMIGGVDNQYKHGEFYPGVTQFGLELARAKQVLPKLLFHTRNVLNRKQKQGNDYKSTSIEPSKVSVLTARAKELKFAMALKPTSKVCHAFHQRGTAHGLPSWGVGDVQYGSLAEWILSHRRGWRKAKNFGQMVRADERVGDSRKYVFIGDTGDRDEDAAERMAKAFPNKLRAVFLHTVFPVGVDGSAAVSKLRSRSARHTASVSVTSAVKSLPREQRGIVRADRTVNGVPIYYFRTYIGAAVKAYKANLIDLAAVKRVAVQAAADMQQHEKHARERLHTAQQKLLEGKGVRHERRWWAARKAHSVRTATAGAADMEVPSLFKGNRAEAATNPLHRLEANLRSKWVDLCEDARKLDSLLYLVKRPLINFK